MAAKKPKPGPKRGRKSRQRRLPVAPVPASACRYILQAVADAQLRDPAAVGPWSGTVFPRRIRGLDRAGFGVVSHLLGAVESHVALGGRHFMDRLALGQLAGKKDNDTIGVLVGQLRALGILERAWDARREVRRATEYELGSGILKAILKGDDRCRYSSWDDFLDDQVVDRGPWRDLDPDAARVWDAELRAAILDLQRVGLQFDRRRCLEWLGSGPGGLDTSVVNHLMAFAFNLDDGDNYGRFRSAESGRIQSYGSPCLQNVPKLIRRFFYPTAGSVFLDFDFASQETWLIAHLSGDEHLKRALSSGGLYELVVDRFGLTRDQAKRAVNARNYGAGRFALAQSMDDLPPRRKPSSERQELAQRIKDFLDAEFPISTAWMKKVAGEIASSGIASSAMGFTRKVDPKEAYKVGVCHVIQSTAADIMKEILRQLPARVHGLGRLLLPIHDGLLVEALHDHADDVQQIVLEVMGAAVTSIPSLADLTIPVKVQQGWRDKSDPIEVSNLQPDRL